MGRKRMYVAVAAGLLAGATVTEAILSSRFSRDRSFERDLQRPQSAPIYPEKQKISSLYEGLMELRRGKIRGDLEPELHDELESLFESFRKLKKLEENMRNSSGTCTSSNTLSDFLYGKKKSGPGAESTLGP